MEKLCNTIESVQTFIYTFYENLLKSLKTHSKCLEKLQIGQVSKVCVLYGVARTIIFVRQRVRAKLN